MTILYIILLVVNAYALFCILPFLIEVGNFLFDVLKESFINALDRWKDIFKRVKKWVTKQI